MQITVFINKIYQERGKPTVLTATNGGEFGPPLLQIELSEQQRIDIAPRISMPIKITLTFYQ